VAHQSDRFDRGTLPEGVQHMVRRDGVMLEGATVERDETSEQTSGPGECVRDSEVAKQRQTTREDGWEVDERYWFFDLHGQRWSEVEDFEVWCGAEGGEKWGQLPKSSGIVKFFDSVGEFPELLEASEVGMIGMDGE
jgi:hypothetical protein